MEYKLIGNNNYNGDLRIEYFKNRGFKNPNELSNLNSSVIRDPFDFTNIKEGIELIKKCEEESKDILIIPDSDADGITSSALLYRFLTQVFFGEVKYRQHDDKLHGIILEEIEDMLENIGLIIVPDGGSGDFEQHKYLKEKGIDVLVIDHHKCDKGRSPYATVINNQLDGISLNMCGASMAYYFCKAFESTIEENICDDMLDIVAVGLIGDIMDSSDPEVQYMIQEGFKNINNEFLLQLLESTSFSRKGKENQRAFAFYIVPLFNAVVRCGTMEENNVMFEALAGINVDRVFEHTFKRGDRKGTTIEEDLYQYAYRMSNSIKGKQTRLRDKIMNGSKRPKKSGLMELIDSNYKEDNILMIDATDYIDNKNMTGLVAGGISSKTGKPTLIYIKDEDGNYNGSCRNNQILNFRKKLNENNLISRNEGHEFAFGSSIYSKESTLEEARKKVNDFFKDEDLRIIHKVDFNIPQEEFDEYIVSDLSQLEDYFGSGMEEPLILIENLTVKSNLIRQSDSGNMFYFYINDVKLMCFDKGGSIFDKVVDWGDAMCYNVIGKPSVYNEDGSRICQLLIEDIELVDVINKENNDIEDFESDGDDVFYEEHDDDEWEW